MKKLLFFILSASIITSCSTSKKESNWSGKMADAVMYRYDSLMYYVTSKPYRWQYDIAFLGQAIDKLGKKDKKYSDYMKRYVDYFIGEDGSIKFYKQEEYNIDRINPGKNLLTLYKRTGEEKYKTAAARLVEQMKHHPKTETGGYWHKKIYPYQMWLDGIYMASPFLAEYASMFDEPEWFDEIVHQITLIEEKTRDDKTGLLYHAWDESKEQRWCNPETGRSKHFWSRAIGWYAMAIVDVLDYLPEEHSGRKQLITILNRLAEALIKVQDEKTGLWYQVLNYGGREGNYLEASGSAMFTYSFLKGVSKGYLDKKYIKYATKAFNGIVNNLITEDEDGYPSLQQTCGGCGLGGKPYREGDYEYYITEKIVENDSKGVAPFILAAIEIELLTKKQRLKR